MAAPFASRIVRIAVYETRQFYYLVGQERNRETHRILKVDRTAQNELVLSEDPSTYTAAQINSIIASLQDGNMHTGGISKELSCWGLLGFMKFEQSYHMLLITRRGAVATLGGHFIYHIDGTTLLPVNAPTTLKSQAARAKEAAQIAVFKNLDLTKTFYFSYHYDLTRPLQNNYLDLLSNNATADYASLYERADDTYVWNDYLVREAVNKYPSTRHWFVSIIHGFIDQANISVLSKSIYVTLIARRSRHHAGARYLKRGTDSEGHVANAVQTEQIVSDQVTSPFIASNTSVGKNYTSYVQYRGSIPVYWSQEPNNISPKPMIELGFRDPFFVQAAQHFNRLYGRFGSPIIVLNLVKQKEKTAREQILLKEYRDCIDYLNQHLPPEHRIRHHAWDMAKASKSRSLEVIDCLEKMAKEFVAATEFFHIGQEYRSPKDRDLAVHLQHGVVRTNCIDCLDRTNAAQFVIGKKALALQLKALGVIKESSLPYDSDAVNLLTEMYHDHGDTIALQYGGSHLVNTLESYRKINQWRSHSRDLIESIRRYYSNSFMDAQRQEATDVFLGNTQHAPTLEYSIVSEYDLQANYSAWFTREYLYQYLTDARYDIKRLPKQDVTVWWSELYRPYTLSTIGNMFANNINSTVNYLPGHESGAALTSPFVRRHHITSKLEGEDSELARLDRKGLAKSKAHKPKSSISSWVSLPKAPKFNPMPKTRKPTEVTGRMQDVLKRAEPDDTMSREKVKREEPAVVTENAKEGSRIESRGRPYMDVTEMFDEYQEFKADVDATEQEEYTRYLEHPNVLLLPVDAQMIKYSEYVPFVENWGIFKGPASDASPEATALYEKYTSMHATVNPRMVSDEANRRKSAAYRSWTEVKGFLSRRSLSGTVDMASNMH